MGIQRLQPQSGGGTDFTGLKPYIYNSDFLTAGVKLDITGKGMAQIMLFNNSSGSITPNVKITVDGVILFNGTFTIFDYDHYIYGYPSYNTVDGANKWGYYGKGDVSNKSPDIKSIQTGAPYIGFKQSLKIEANAVSTSNCKCLTSVLM